MAESTTTTTTTTEAPKVDPVPTGNKASVNHPGGEASPVAERQGEVKVDKGLKTDVVGGGTIDGETAPERESRVQAENLEQAKQDGLRASKLDQENQPTEAGRKA